MNNIKRKTFCVICIILMISFPLTSLAHSGRTDSSGGHHDYQNKSGLGSYHYHHGMGPHLHPNGICPYAPKDYITITNYSSEVYVGDYITLEFITTSYYNDFSWRLSSSDSSILEIADDNSVIGVGIGTASITISTYHTEKTVSITVKEVFAEEIELYVSTDELQVGETMQITGTLYPTNTTNQEIIYLSSNNSIATVSPDGIIEGISSGIATITATSSNGISESVDIEIYEVFPEKILCDNSINMIVGDSIELPVKIIPSNANNKQYSVTCDNDEILKCSNSELTAIMEGNTELHIETWNGIKKDIAVKIDIIPAEDIKIADIQEYRFSNVIDINDKITLRYSVFPVDATYQQAEWKSSDENIVKIDNNDFVITGTGEVTISCVAHNGIVASIDMYIIDLNLIIFISSISGIIFVSSVVAIIIIKHKSRHKSGVSINNEENKVAL